jgi:hypothetical protein
VFEERIGLLRELSRTMDQIYESFLTVRASSSWEGHISSIRRWIKQAGKPVSQAATPTAAEAFSN